MMPLVGAKESEEVVVRRIVRRLERYFEELEGLLNSKPAGGEEFNFDGVATATSNQYAESATPEMQAASPLPSEDSDDLDAPTVRKPQAPQQVSAQAPQQVSAQAPQQVSAQVPQQVSAQAPPKVAVQSTPHVKHEPEFPMAPPLPKIPGLPPLPLAPVVSQSDNSPAQPYAQRQETKRVPDNQDVSLQSSDQLNARRAQDGGGHLMFDGRPTPFHKPSKVANAGVLVAVAFAVILVGLLALYILLGPEFRSH